MAKLMGKCTDTVNCCGIVIAAVQLIEDGKHVNQRVTRVRTEGASATHAVISG